MHSESSDPDAQKSFRICENCGRPTPSSLPQCVNCGAVSAYAVAAEREARAEKSFLNALFARSTPVTHAILIFNIIVYLLMTYVAGRDFFAGLVGGADAYTLVAFGAKMNALLREGEWFRLVTPIFIHIGLLHLASNSYALWTIGPLVEKMYGSARYLLIYLLAGIGGVFGSYLWNLMSGKPDGPSAGASGAIFGLFGLLVVVIYKYKNELPPTFQRAIKSSVVPVIVINLFIGFSFPFIDNAAHVGGLLAGGLLTLLIPYLPPGSKRMSGVGLVIMGVCIAVIVYSFARAYQTSGRYLELRREENPGLQER